MATTTTSKRFTLNLRDFSRGLLMAVIGGIIGALYPLAQDGPYIFEWHLVLKGAITACLAYLSKNFTSATEIVITDPSKTSVEAVKKGTAQVNIQNKQ